MKETLLPMNLQFFAEDDPAGADDVGEKKTEPMSFDDFLKEGKNQAEFDRRVAKAISTAQEKWQALTDDKLSEAEKLAKMNANEKAQYMQQKKEKELAAREAEITRRELMATAKNTLAEKNLPVDLAEVLDYADADRCSQSITKVESAFQKAVEAAVQERLKGKEPPKKAPASSEETLEEEVRNALKGTI